MLMEEQSLQPKVIKKKYIISFFVIVVLLFGYIFFYMSPKEFPMGQVITVSSGESLQGIADTLHNANVIKSPFFFRTAVIMLGGEKKVMAGDYFLDRREGSLGLAYRLVKGDFHLTVKKITIPEGWNIFQINSYLEKQIINWNKSKFLSLAKNQEGYLFPDTYFVSPTIKPEEVISRMKDNFEKKISSVEAISTSTHSLEDIIIMASILENEARTTESRKIIAGILWKRLKLGMPLQVDSTFSYINGKNTYELTVDDLKIDSPYNTYKYRGFPPGPIGNPGLDSINDAVNPTTTKYLYFLSSRDGIVYYAKNFEEHQVNREKYLNK